MATERDVVALLHRADWTRLSLSGMVPGNDEETVEIAPGTRYRVASAGGRRARGSDGERIWEWFAELPPETDASLGGGPEPPFPVLLAPAWLLSGYSLAVVDETTACGRAGVRVTATRLSRPGGVRVHGMMVPVAPPWLAPFAYDRVTAVVDAELGILLSCEGQRADHEAEVTEFRALTVGAEADPERFTAPEGSIVGDAGWQPFGAAGREVAKTVAGLAAGGLGAAIKYTPSKHEDPFAQATRDGDPEPAMPEDDLEPGLAAGGPVGAEVLHVLYRSGIGAPRFTATLHQWIDGVALFEAVPESAR